MKKQASDQYIERLDKQSQEMFGMDIRTYLREQTVNKRLLSDVAKDFDIPKYSMMCVYRKLGVIWHKNIAPTKRQLIHRDVYRKQLTVMREGL